MPRSRLFWNLIAKSYAQKPVEDEASYQRKLRETQALLHKGMDVLEVGCGSGSTALTHAPFVRHIRATDYAPKMIEIAQAKARAANITNVSFEAKCLESLEATKSRYDVVFALSLLHLLEHRAAGISRIHRLVKPGGLFISSTVCAGEMKGIAKTLLPLGSALRLLPLVRVFTAKDLAADLQAAGFEIETKWQPGPGKSVFIIARKPA